MFHVFVLVLLIRLNLHSFLEQVLRSPFKHQRNVVNQVTLQSIKGILGMINLKKLNNCNSVFRMHKKMLNFSVSFKHTHQFLFGSLPGNILDQDCYLGSFSLTHVLFKALNVHSVLKEELLCTIHEFFLNKSLQHGWVLNLLIKQLLFTYVEFLSHFFHDCVWVHKGVVP